MNLFFIVSLLLFLLCFTPIQMGLTMILLVFSVCLIMFSSFLSGWMPMIIFLTYLGGLLVLILYVCAVSSNYSTNKNFSWFTFLLFSVSLEKLSYSFWTKNFIILEYSNSNLTVFCVSYLLYGLIALILICSKHSGPMKV